MKGTHHSIIRLTYELIVFRVFTIVILRWQHKFVPFLPNNVAVKTKTQDFSDLRANFAL